MPLSAFQVLFNANLIFNDFSRHFCIIQELFKTVRTLYKYFPHVKASFEQTKKAPHPQCYIPTPKVISGLVLEKLLKLFFPHINVVALLVICQGSFEKLSFRVLRLDMEFNLPSGLEEMFENVDRQMDDRPMPRSLAYY